MSTPVHHRHNLPTVRRLSGRCSRLAAAAAVACLCVASALWIAASVGHEPPRGVIVRRSSSFAVLETPATPDDSLPQEVVDALVHSVEPEITRTAMRTARRVLADNPTWLVRAPDGELCLVGIVYPLPGSWLRAHFTPTVTRECAPERDAASGRLVGTQSLGVSVATSEMARVVGVVPNGTGSVVIVARDGQRAAAMVDRNAYELTVREPVALTFTTTHRGHRVTRHIALATFNKRDARQTPASTPAGSFG
jgi:hypothetical protein